MMKKRDLKLLGKLNAKIIIMTVVIIAAVSVIIFSYLYSYFYGIEVERVIHGQQVKFSGYIDEINKIYQNAHHLGQMMAIEDDIQNYLSLPAGTLSEVDENRIIRKIVGEISHAMTQYETISSVALVKNGEISGWTEVTSFDEQSWEIRRDWYLKFKEAAEDARQTNEVVSKPYTFTMKTMKGTKKLTLVSLQMPVYSIKNAQNSYGSLIINVDAETLLRIFNKENDYSAILLEGEDGSLFASKGDTDIIASAEHTDATFPAVFTGNTKFALTLKTVYEKPMSFQMSGKDTIRLVAVIIATVLGILLAISVIMIYLLRPIKTLQEAMDGIGKGNLDIRVDIKTGDEFELLGNYLNRMTVKLKDSFEDRLNAEKEKHEMEYALLVAQINPHFIYNTLNTVIYLARKDKSKDVIQLTKALIELLQNGIKLSGNRNFATVDEELSAIRNYVLIQNYRYSDVFLLEISCDDDVGGRMIPVSVIQPFVENALFHGIVPMNRQGKVSLCIRSMAQDGLEGLEIRLDDNGVGMSEEKIETILSGSSGDTGQSRNHIGIHNVLSRLSLLYGNTYRFTMHSEPGKGTQVSIVIPNNSEK